MQTPVQITIRSLFLTAASIFVVLAINLVPAGDMQTFVLALDDQTTNTAEIEYTGVPGDVIKGQIVLKNPSLTQKTVQISLDDLEQEKIAQNNLTNTPNLYGCCKEWFVFPQGNIYTIEPDSKAVVHYEMHIPANAEAKNYYGALMVNETGAQKTHLCNIVKLKIFHKLSPNLGMAANAYGASEINLYSPVLSVLAALMLAAGMALFGRWCLKKFK